MRLGKRYIIPNVILYMKGHGTSSTAKTVEYLYSCIQGSKWAGRYQRRIRGFNVYSEYFSRVNVKSCLALSFQKVLLQRYCASHLRTLETHNWWASIGDKALLCSAFDKFANSCKTPFLTFLMSHDLSHIESHPESYSAFLSAVIVPHHSILILCFLAILITISHLTQHNFMLPLLFSSHLRNTSQPVLICSSLSVNCTLLRISNYLNTGLNVVAHFL